jgi:hypothetical protein
MSTTKLVHLFPTIDEFLISFGDLKVDGSSPSTHDVDQDLAPEFGTPYVDVSRCRGWRTLSIPVSVSPDLSTLPESLRDASVFNVLLCTSSPTAKVRRAAPLSFNGENRWGGNITVDRLEVRDRVVVTVRLMALKDILDGEGRAVWFRGAVVGESFPVDIYVDENVRPYNGPIKWSWVDFGTSDNKSLNARPSELYFIDSADAPVVFLNRGIPDFKSVLDGKDRSGPWSGIRHVTEVSVAVPVYIHLLLDSLMRFSKDEETDDYALDGSWRTALVKACAKTLYPGEAPNAKEVLQRFREQFDDPSSRSAALAVVVSLAQRFAKVDRKFAAAISSAEAFAKKEEELS